MTTGFDFQVTLRIFHPTCDPQEITDTLGMAPCGSFRAGMPRTTPKGKPLQGLNQQTSWMYEVPVSGNLPETLTQELNNLFAYRDYFWKLIATGGYVEFFIGWFADQKNSGESLDWSLLAKCADLRINISLDIYSK